MKRSHYVLFFLGCFITWGALGQTFKKHTNNVTHPKEIIYLHQNTTLLLTGEYLYYKLYCVEPKNGQLSKLSKIAYVELVGEDLNIVFKHKIRLKNGLGEADYFIPTSVPSGNYKLIAYTRWMQNQGNDSFFQSNITIINPYRGNQKRLLNDKTTNVLTSTQTIPLKQDPLNKVVKNNTIVLNTQKDTFAQRERVTVKFQSQKETSIIGHYSISIRKMDTLQMVSFPSASSFKSIGKKVTSKNSGLLLPELRGELFYGKIVAKDSLTTIANKKVAISLPGEKFALKIATTDTLGNFAFSLDKAYDSNNAYAQVLEQPDSYLVELTEKPSALYDKLVFDKFIMTSAMEEAILERSLYNQISNAYFSIRPDTLVNQTYKPPFSHKNTQTYHLDDYTRFPSVKETFVELIKKASLVKGENKEYVFKVLPENSSLLSEWISSLLIVDGMMILNHNDFVDFNARKIKTIHIIKSVYFYGSEIFNGIIQIETIDGHYNKLNNPYVSKFPLLRPQNEKRYFQQTYKDALKVSEDRVPDFRYQLLWMPKLKIKNQHDRFSFFTSDITGDFEICLNGLTNDGKPLSFKKIITVK